MTTKRRVPIVFSILAAVTVALVALPLWHSGGDVAGTLRFLTQFGIFVVIFAIITVGLNVQLGYAGISNFGVAGFFLLGSYVAGLFVIPPSTSQYVTYVGGFGEALDLFPSARSGEWLPFLVGLVAAAGACALLAAILSALTPRLREDYLAIATIGVAELLRAVTTVETGLVNGDRGLIGITGPLDGFIPRSMYQVFYLGLAVVVLALLYLVAERAVRSPYGRVLRAIREDEVAATAAGKNIFAFKLQSFMLGAAITGAGAALYAWYSRGLTPSAFEPFQGTFIFWVMLIVGGVGSNLGAIVGAYIVWGLWSMSLQLASFDLPEVIQGRIPYIRLVVLGVFFIAMLLLRPQGLIPEQQRVSRWLGTLTLARSREGLGSTEVLQPALDVPPPGPEAPETEEAEDRAGQPAAGEPPGRPREGDGG